MTTELLGPNLKELKNFSGGRFSTPTILRLSQSILKLLKKLHDTGHCHNDVKLDNFVLGLGDADKLVYMVDFGFTKKFRKQRTFAHIKKKNIGMVIGSPAYQSLNAHLGNSLSRQDDLESFAYVLVDQFYPRLLEKIIHKRQVQLQNAKKKLAKYMHISQKFDQEVIDIVKYCQNLGFDEDPDYEFVLNLLGTLIKRADARRSEVDQDRDQISSIV